MRHDTGATEGGLRLAAFEGAARHAPLASLLLSQPLGIVMLLFMRWRGYSSVRERVWWTKPESRRRSRCGRDSLLIASDGPGLWLQCPHPPKEIQTGPFRTRIAPVQLRVYDNLNAVAAASAHYKSVELWIPNSHFVGVKERAYESKQCIDGPFSPFKF